MVKFYAYYSFGGYREFYLGNSRDAFTYSWFFPMLPIWEARLGGSRDEILKKRIGQARALPQIEDVGKGGENAIPAEASPLVSHGGYDVIYRTAGHHQVLAVKDIDSKDDSGRPAPFLMLFVAGDEEGVALLDKLAEHLLTELRPFKEKLSELFIYDLDMNGLRFNVRRMNAILAEMAGQAPAPRVAWHSHHPVHTIITAQKLDVTLRNQNIAREDVFFASDLNGNVLLERRGEEVPVEVTAEQPSGETADGHSGKRRGNLPPMVRYFIIAAAALLLAAIANRSCKKDGGQEINQTTQVLRYEKTL